MRVQKHLKLKSLSSDEVDLETWAPKSPEDIHICLDMGIRVRDIEGEITLNVTLASPEALRFRKNSPALVEKHTVVVEKYDYESVKKLLRGLISKCNRETRYDSCLALQQYFQWEYDYCKLKNTH
ncbi:MAG: Imm8 family immunity protein [Gammaproteobacteria bacterium]